MRGSTDPNLAGAAWAIPSAWADEKGHRKSLTSGAALERVLDNGPTWNLVSITPNFIVKNLKASIALDERSGRN